MLDDGVQNRKEKLLWIFFTFIFVVSKQLSLWTEYKLSTALAHTSGKIRDKKVYASIVPHATSEKMDYRMPIYVSLDLCCFESYLLSFQIFSSYLRRVKVLETKMFKIPFLLALALDFYILKLF